MVNWVDGGIKWEVRVSTDGDFVKLGKSTLYPFVAGGGGIPVGWTQFISSNAGPIGAVGDVSWTTAYGRFSVGNLGTDPHNAKLYGIYRDFTINPNKRWLIQVQARTTAGRSSALRYVKWIAPAGPGNTYYSQVWTYEDWENVSLYTATITDTTMRVSLYAAPYTAADSAPHAPADANWGIQFQNVTLVEMEPTYPPPTWKTITCDIHSLTTHHGRDKFLSRYDVATAQLEIINDDGEFTYGLADWLRPGRFINVRATEPGSGFYAFYYGIIDSITNGFTLDGHAVVSFACVDISSLLSNITVPTYSDQYDTFVSGARFLNVAQSAGWHPQFITYATGIYVQQAILANGRTVRDELGLIADSEGGAFYGDRSGRLAYRDRNWTTTDSWMNTVQAELLATPTNDNLPPVDAFPTSSSVRIIELRSIATDWSRDRIVNEATLANAGGTSITTSDFDSQTKYGPRTYQRLDLINDNTHPEYLTERTSDIMKGYADAILRVNNVEYTPQPDDYWFSLNAFLNWAVRVRYEHPTEHWGFTVVSHIQGLTHTITAKSWRVTFTLDQPEAFSYYRLSTAGWDNGLWDDALWDGLGTESAWTHGDTWNDPNTKWGT